MLCRLFLTEGKHASCFNRLRVVCASQLIKVCFMGGFQHPRITSIKSIHILPACQLESLSWHMARYPGAWTPMKPRNCTGSAMHSLISTKLQAERFIRQRSNTPILWHYSAEETPMATTKRWIFGFEDLQILRKQKPARHGSSGAALSSMCIVP